MLEDAIAAFLGKFKREWLNNWSNAFVTDRHISRKGNTVISGICQGEYISGGSINDPIIDSYEEPFTAVFSPCGELMQEYYD